MKRTRKLKITCTNKTKNKPSCVKFIVTENEKILLKEIWEVPVANIRHYIVVASQNQWQTEFQQKQEDIRKQFNIAPENIDSFVDKSNAKEYYQTDLTQRRKEFGLTEEQIIEARNKKKRLSQEKTREYQRNYRREYRRIERMRKLNPETEL